MNSGMLLTLEVDGHGAGSVTRHAWSCCITGPEMGISDATHNEPSMTILSVAAKLKGLPYRHGAHPSAYTFSSFARSALD
jgi:hypothetical protein